MSEPLERDLASDDEQVAASRLGAAAFVSDRAARGERGSEDLHVCPTCASGLVFPIDWAPAGQRGWLVDLRCPDCEWTGSGIYAQGVVDKLDEALDDGTDAMLNDLAVLARANMEAEVDRFAAALRDDHLLPEDF